ncbi:MAG: TonB family protein [Cytophagales bacterium]|nr:TonB family protein [Bernardetiaceae bacterium]MDW8203582.1 TonB family protein [Cytophagales bacterium]
MKIGFTNGWYWSVLLVSICFLGACQEPEKEEKKMEEPVAEQVKPTPMPIPVESIKKKEEQKQPEPEIKPEPKPVEKQEKEKKKVAKSEKPKPEQKEEPVIIADQPAEPISGYPAYYRYIKSSLQYPEEAKKHNAEGQVFVEFVVRKDGTLEDVKVQSGKGIGYGCDEEAVRVVKQGEKWKPAIHKGEPVAQRVTLPIKFKLN